MIRHHLQTKPSRRAALISVATIGMSLITSAISADDSVMSVAKKRQMLSSVIPIASRTIRLRPVTADFPRAVVTAVAADPRGEVVAVAGDDHAIRILDASTMRVVDTLTAHRDLVKTITFDPDGDKLVSAGNDGQLIVWDREDDYKILQRMRGTPAIACVRFAPDGKEMAAVGFDNAVYIIGRGDRDAPVFKCDCKDLRAAVYRDDNELLAVAGRSGDLHLFIPETGELVFEQPIHNGRIYDLEFMRDANTLVSVGEDGTLVVFDTRTLKTIKRVRVTTGKLFSVSLIDSVNVAVAGSDNVIRIVDTTLGKVIRSLEGHQGSVPTLAFNGQWMFSGGYDATLRRWAVDQIGGDRQRIAEGDHGIDR